MRDKFSFQNPTRIRFGKNALSYLEWELSAFGERILLVYGSGSVKRTGVYDQVMEELARSGKKVRELSGVPSNPTASKVYEGIAIAKKWKPDLILAVGGGSSIDCAKAIAAGALTEKDFWESFYLDKEEPEEALPIGVVLTMAGTASEMNGNAVITNEKTKMKMGMFSGALYPVFSILNPELTYTVPTEQMVSGICDIMSHILEIYMSPTDDENLSDDLAEAIMKNVVYSTRLAIKDQKDYNARSNLMWAATLGLNGILEPFKEQDWMAHQIEHQIGAYSNCPHGLGMAAVLPGYYRMVCPYGVDRFFRFATRVWGIDAHGKDPGEVAMEGIDALEAFFREIGAPTNLRELGLDETFPIDAIAESCNILKGGYVTLSRDQIRALLWGSLR